MLLLELNTLYPLFVFVKSNVFEVAKLMHAVISKQKLLFSEYFGPFLPNIKYTQIFYSLINAQKFLYWTL